MANAPLAENPVMRKVVIVAFDGMQVLDVVGPWEVFDAATQLLGDRGGYRVVVATPDGRPVHGSAGVRLGADAALERMRPTGVDTVRHPTVRVEPDRIFVRDDHVTTSAGVTAGMDMTLALVEEDHGPDLARSVARWLVMFLQRPGGQSQFSERLSVPAGTDSPIRGVLDGIVANPAGDHRQSSLARRASLSERHLRRLFVEQTRTTPARFVERVRVEAARELLERATIPIGTVAERAGFGSPETMRRAFLRVLGVGPADYRARFCRTASAAINERGARGQSSWSGTQSSTQLHRSS